MALRAIFKTQLKRFLEVYFRNLARAKKRYIIQRTMRTKFHGRYVVRSYDFGSVFLDTTAYEDDRHAKFGFMEPQLHDIFRTFIAGYSIVLDIGANSGLHSLFFSKIQRDKEAPTRANRNRPGGKIYSFEPVPFNFSALCRNLALNEDNSVEPIHMAASDTSGSSEMFVLPEGHYWQGCHSLVRNEKLSGVHSEQVELTEVQTVTIDEFLSERDEQLPVSFIKIDVEGAENKVLRGAMKTIENFKPVLVVEFTPDRVQFLSTPADIFQELTDKGYRVFAIFKDGSMWEVDSITDYVTRGTMSGDTQAQKMLAGRNSGELLFVHEERLQQDGSVQKLA